MSIMMALFGGLGLFLYGMNTMSEGLEKAAGDRMKSIIEMLTKNKIMGVFVGAVVTMIVQSSSATTVMVVGFVNAGIMNLTQAVGIIMGANIGTTITAQLVSIKLDAIAPIAIGMGVLINLVAKSDNVKKYAQILIGFGILFLGMDFMKDAVKPLRSYEGFTTLLSSFGSGQAMDTVLAIFTGFAITAVVQSSSATTGILVALASEGLLPIEAALPVLLGTNVGTCVTAMISSIGASKTAKRAAVIHLLFNIIGTIIFAVVLARPTIAFVTSIGNDSARQLANAHTLFNITNTLLLLPFAGLLVKLAEKFVPGGPEADLELKASKYLDERILETPSIALGQVVKETLHMANVAKESYVAAIDAFINGDGERAQHTFALEKQINLLESEIMEYLIKLSNTNVSVHQREQIDGLFSTINDIERVGDHSDNMAELAMYKIDKNLDFSENAIKELEHMSERVYKSYDHAIDSLATGDISAARKVLEREGEIDLLEKNLRKKHIKRLNAGDCQPSSGVLFLDLISNLERIGDHASNIALAVLDNVSES
ncbi:MAG: Na/Pi cotransporter family protein [Clostridia bacterium]|nr:Na/Pi cotransporter family protein [Clostridia bacterium]